MIHLGIDISKADFHVYGQSKERCFKQTARGFSSLITWAKKMGPASELVFVMEATGSYHLKLATALYSKGYGVAVINPQRIHHHAKSMGSRVKSDKVDARIICEFGRLHNIEGTWKPLAEVIVQLRFWIKDQDHLHRHITSLTNRIKSLELQTADLSYELKELRSRREELRKRLEHSRKQAEKLSKVHRKTRELLLSIPGVGAVTASCLITLFHSNYQIDTARQAESLAGLSLRRFDSGKSVHKRPYISRMGPPSLRKALYMAALSAKKHNPACKAMYERILEKGRPKKVALIAVACKLLRQAFGVLKSNIPFDPELSVKNLAQKRPILDF